MSDDDKRRSLNRSIWRGKTQKKACASARARHHRSWQVSRIRTCVIGSFVVNLASHVCLASRMSQLICLCAMQIHGRGWHSQSHLRVICVRNNVPKDGKNCGFEFFRSPIWETKTSSSIESKSIKNVYAFHVWQECNEDEHDTEKHSTVESFPWIREFLFARHIPRHTDASPVTPPCQMSIWFSANQI